MKSFLVILEEKNVAEDVNCVQLLNQLFEVKHITVCIRTKSINQKDFISNWGKELAFSDNHLRDQLNGLLSKRPEDSLQIQVNRVAEDKPITSLYDSNLYDSVIITTNTDRKFTKGLIRNQISFLRIPANYRDNVKTLDIPLETQEIEDSFIDSISAKFKNLSRKELNFHVIVKNVDWYINQTVYSYDEVDHVLENKSTLSHQISKLSKVREEKILDKALKLHTNINTTTVSKGRFDQNVGILADLNIQSNQLLWIESDLVKMDSSGILGLLENNSSYPVLITHKTPRQLGFSFLNQLLAQRLN